ncbi:MAG TPA: response regulator transcription factor [Lapillicoccus sp.]|nr:response regulator transcription factor [Lapillicoccus sp.]
MRLLIGEDEALLRAGLALVLAQHGIEIVGTTGSATELVELARERRPDLVLTDIRMPPNHTDDGLRAAIQIRKAKPGMPVVLLSQFVQRRYALELLADNAGCIGYLLKQRVLDVPAFVEDLQRVSGGGTALDPEVVSLLIRRTLRDHEGLDSLSPRRREVLALIAEGLSNAAIARRLFITEKAVVAHASAIYDALGLPVDADEHRRVLAVIAYLGR